MYCLIHSRVEGVEGIAEVRVRQVLQLVYKLLLILHWNVSITDARNFFKNAWHSYANDRLGTCHMVKDLTSGWVVPWC